MCAQRGFRGSRRSLWRRSAVAQLPRARRGSAFDAPLGRHAARGAIAMPAAALTDEEILGNKKSCTVPLLQKAAQARGLDDGGKRAELIERLCAHIRASSGAAAAPPGKRQRTLAEAPPNSSKPFSPTEEPADGPPPAAPPQQPAGAAPSRSPPAAPPAPQPCRRRRPPSTAARRRAEFEAWGQAAPDSDADEGETEATAAAATAEEAAAWAALRRRARSGAPRRARWRSAIRRRPPPRAPSAGRRPSRQLVARGERAVVGAREQRALRATAGRSGRRRGRTHHRARRRPALWAVAIGAAPNLCGARCARAPPRAGRPRRRRRRATARGARPARSGRRRGGGAAVRGLPRPRRCCFVRADRQRWR